LRAKQRAILREVSQAIRGSGPVLAGPWRGDLGFELLYWIPLLRRLVETMPGLAERLIVISRGGVESWYGGMCSHYLDAFDLMPLEELASFRVGEHTKSAFGVKQARVEPLDEELLRRAASRLGIGAHRTLGAHLAAVLMRLTKGEAFPLGAQLLSYAPVTPGPLPPGLELPEEFVAIRFYGNPQLPRSDANRERVPALVERIAARQPVVMLGHSLSIDDHRDFNEVAQIRGVISVEEHMLPETNLGVQTAVLGRAAAYIGTYGGLSYLAPLLGVPATGLYSIPEKITDVYLRLAHYAAHSVGGRYRTIDLSDPTDVVIAAAVGNGCTSAA
jgi:hypothetical protein